MGVAVWSAATLILSLGGMCVLVVGMASPYWHFVPIPRGDVYWGLWKTCSTTLTGVTRCIYWVNVETPGYLRTAQFFVTVGLLCALLGSLLLLLVLFVPVCQPSQATVLASGTSHLVACVCVLVGVFAFGCAEQERFYLHWAFGLTVISGIALGVAAVVILAHRVTSKRLTIKD